jgi:hypothetical protein
MYSIQALWSAAHHDLDIVFVILVNREYRILKHNMDTYRQRFDANSNQDYPRMNLENPNMDFVSIAQGMGVPGCVISQPDELAASGRKGYENEYSSTRVRRPFRSAVGKDDRMDGTPGNHEPIAGPIRHDPSARPVCLFELYRSDGC